MNEAEEKTAAEETPAQQPPKEAEQEPRAEETVEDENAKKLEALNDKYMRTLAEYDNYRKRSIREKEAIYPKAKADAAAKFLPVMDNLERALAVETEKNAFYDGVVLVKKQLDEVFKGLGVEEISAGAGEPFDPELHNAVMHVEDESLGEGVIVEELQKGYRMGDKVLRHSMVKAAN